jgi:hypothetical protein
MTVPCIDCRVLCQATRCDACKRKKERVRNARRAHYKGSYRSEAARVRELATNCWLCGGGARVGDPFTADHVEPSITGSVLLPAHRSCNSRRGATHRRD